MTPSISIAGGTPVGGLRKWHYRTYQLHPSFGIERDTVHLVGYQRIGAANPLVGGVTQQGRHGAPDTGAAHPSWMNRRCLCQSNNNLFHGVYKVCFHQLILNRHN
jgi:hypothetical protein